MAARAPRHLAKPPKRLGLTPLQRVFLVSLLALAAVTAVIALLARDAGSGRERTAAPTTTRATTAATTGPGSAASTTTPATRPVRPIPGNLLADGDFERDLAGWAPLGGASLERVEGGVSGRWAAAVAPGPSRDEPPGMVRSGVATARAGTTYEAVLWVQVAPGGQVVLALRELADGRVVSSDEAGYTVPGGWRQVAVEHHTRVPGSSLSLEVVGRTLPGDGRLLVDAVALLIE